MDGTGVWFYVSSATPFRNGCGYRRNSHRRDGLRLIQTSQNDRQPHETRLLILFGCIRHLSADAQSDVSGLLVDPDRVGDISLERTGLPASARVRQVHESLSNRTGGTGAHIAIWTGVPILSISGAEMDVTTQDWENSAAGPLAGLLAEDHRRLDAFLHSAVADPLKVDRAAYDRFRAGLLRHIGMEEKILLPAAQQLRGGEPLSIARKLRLDHGALGALLMPTPTAAILAKIRGILADHNALEEGQAGLYGICDRLAGRRS